jgi:enterochelin esterase family protein
MVLSPDSEWEKIASGMKFCDACCTDNEGNFYFADSGNNEPIKKVSHDGSVKEYGPSLYGVSGLQFGKDSSLYICQAKARRISVLKNGESLETVIENVRPNDLVVTNNNQLYFTETSTQRVYHVNLNDKIKVLRIVDTGILKPNGIGLTPCDGTLFVSDQLDKEVWFFRIEKNHRLTMKAPYASLRIRAKNLPSRGDGCDVDSLNRYYVTSDLGIQMFDPTGRLGGIILSPDPMKPVVSIAFSGKDFRYLYVANGGSIYRRLMKVSGVGR